MNVYCIKCGAEGDSKCPHCRSVFNSNHLEVQLSHVLKFDLINLDGASWLQVRLRIPPEFCVEDEEATLADAHIGLYEILKMMIEGHELPLKQWICRHEWRLKPGHKSLIGCRCSENRE